MNLTLSVIIIAIVFTLFFRINIEQNNIEYIYFTPGPLSTTKTVKEVSKYDYSSREPKMQQIIKDIRSDLLDIYSFDKNIYSSILFPGSGTFAIESIISSYPFSKSVLLLNNGYYSDRILKILKKYNINTIIVDNIEKLVNFLLSDREYISDVILVHCETSTGIINNIEKIQKIIGNRGLIIDTMSSFAGININPENITFLVSSSGKCIQGLAGISFIIGKINDIKKCKDSSKTFSLDLYKQWDTLENTCQFPYTPPVTILPSFNQALKELNNEKLENRIARYHSNHIYLKNFMEKLGFKRYTNLTTPIITSFYYPTSNFNFNNFYNYLYSKYLVIYPGSFINNTLRIGTIGNLNKNHFKLLKKEITNYLQLNNLT
jgi:2-aminoethylphosphonate-pyruvate transaminase